MAKEADATAWEEELPMRLERAASLELRCEPYEAACARWPQAGRVILAQYTEEAVVVYQAFSPEIGRWAAENQRFLGCPAYSVGRMSWVKTNWLWMQYRSGWATKKNQEVTLALWLKRSYFNDLLAAATPAHKYDETQTREAFKEAVRASKASKDAVRLQWDPDHYPDGSKHPERRAIQLGLKGSHLWPLVSGSGLLAIQDVTSLSHAGPDSVPYERVYTVEDEDVVRRIGLQLNGEEVEEELAEPKEAD
eukprot:PLAT11547.1.p1 GENE.PLAT11547.1~~PLAT11547.1.p1  ORF type:complete len:273 (+),score=59.78 PLAT11547.1:70-819(+)